MPFIVSKFGGTSLCSGEMFLRAAALVKENPERRIVVASAPGKRFSSDMKVTDLLIGLWENKSERLLSLLEERFLAISEVTRTDLGKELAHIRRLVLKGADRALLVSRGEWLSAKILAQMTGFRFLDAAQAIRFSRGAVHESTTYALIRNAFSNSPGLVLPGFYGADERGEVCLFPRGGSDITGALAAAAVGAALYENWTDVNGVYERDPAEFPDAGLLSELTFDEMQRLCDAGACVLHPDSLLPVRRAGIPVRVKNTFFPGKNGTLIHTA